MLSRTATNAGALPLFELALFAALAALLFGTLARVAAWWDEGWTMLVARTLVERGHYGRLLDGALAPHGLESSPAMVGVVALSYKLLGVGIWQARVPMALLTLGALALLYALAWLLYDRPVARATLLVALLAPVLPQLNVLRLGGEVMADVPMLCFLLGGYICLYGALGARRWLLAPAALLWGIATMLKAQYLLFWALSLALPAALLLVRGERRAGLTLAAALMATEALRELGLVPLQAWLLAGRSMTPTPVVGLFTTLAFVPGEVASRLATLSLSVTFMLPALLACAAAAWRAWGHVRRRAPHGPPDVLRLCLLTLIAVWWGWFAALSIGWTRYVLPAYVISAIFQAELLGQITGGFDLRATLARAIGGLRRPSRGALAALAVALAVPALSTATLLLMETYYRSQSTAPLYQVAGYLNERTPADAVVETYDSELFVLLNRRYHYPVDQVHADLVQQQLLGRAISISYDPLAADPDYLVLGEYGAYSKLYDRVLADGHFRLVLRERGYDVYERVR